MSRRRSRGVGAAERADVRKQGSGSSGTPASPVLGMFASVTLREPMLNLILEVMNDPWTAAVIWRTLTLHSPFRQCRSTKRQVSSSFRSSHSLARIRDHLGHLGSG
jgi:hypothetical protein